MNIQFQDMGSHRVAELQGEGMHIGTLEQGMDLLGQIYFDGATALLLPAACVAPDFFDLSTGLAGELLQKFTNYRVRLFLLGDFAHHRSESLQAFIRESNQGRQVNFVANRAEALQRLGVQLP